MFNTSPKTISSWNEIASFILESYKHILKKKIKTGFKIIDFFDLYFTRVKNYYLKRKIDHPYFHESLKEFFRIWFSYRINLSKYRNQDMYTKLGINSLYSLTHALCCALIPEHFNSSNKSIFKLIPSKFLSPDTKWESFDHKRRYNMAKRIALWIRQNIHKFTQPCLVVDYAGGNSEFGNFLSKELKKYKLDKKVFIVVKEINKGMIDEGRERNKKEGIHNIIFIKCSAELPFEEVRKVLPADLKSSPIIASISSYTIGALSKKVVSKMIVEMHRSLEGNGIFAIWDFIDPKVDLFNFLKSTGKKGIIFQLTRFFCSKPLALCYENWGHDISYLNIAIKLLKTFNQKLSEDWNITSCTILPLLLIKDKILILNIPGFVEKTVSYVKK